MSPRARAKLAELVADLDRMRAEAGRLEERVRELEALADTDPLANVLNRRAFMRELARALAFADRHGGPVSVLYLDLVGFKAVNDRHGHHAGDAAIVHVSALLSRNVRFTDTVGRVGGDEFAIILPYASAAQARIKADDLRAALFAAPVEFEGARLPLDVSIGVHEAASGEAAETALAAADAAMYADKRSAHEKTAQRRLLAG